MKNIVITEAALVAASHPEFPVEQILADGPPDTFANLIIRTVKDSILVATNSCNEGSRVLVIGAGVFKNFGRLRDEEHAIFFERCVRFGLRSFDKSIALSPNAMPYRQGARSSAFASGDTALRILAEEGYEGSRNVYVYDLEEATSVQDLAQCAPDPKPYRLALAALPGMFAVPAVAAPDGGAIDLDWSGTKSVSKGFAYDEWLPLLSKQQKAFVLEREITGPLRVRGAAGTGKTLAMVMKALNVSKRAGDDIVRIVFLTHSWAMAGQIDEMIRSIGRDIPSASLIEVYPLMELARQRDYSLVGRRPLGLDSETGIMEALKVIAELLESFVAGDWIAYRGGCSEEFVARMESLSGSKERRNLEWDLLTEFGSVLAAEGLLSRTADRERYLRVRRMGYMMNLSVSPEKEVVFELWRTFLEKLRDTGFIATDQIVSDYLNDLRTFYWEAKRDVDGYDYIFVDEMHLFNAQERLIFHNLLADANASPKVIMALDPRQSPREIFTGIADEDEKVSQSIYERAQLRNPDKVDFLDVYRSTPEITRLTKTVIDAVPGLDMGDDWNLPIGSSVLGSGPIPQYKAVSNIHETFATAISLAKSLQSEARAHGGQVAILCMDYDRFARLHPAAQGQNPKEVYVIASRDDVERLRFLKQRIVFSTPEYVAGLQFDTVILIDANANLVPDVGYSGAAERRFLSELYLGMSRAERRLVILASKDSGGITPFLGSPQQKNLLAPMQ